MNTATLFNDDQQMKLITSYAEHNELTIDYVIEEFVINGEFITVDVECAS